MTAVGESDPILATKCLDFCQALSSQGVAFNFSVSIGSTFSFSLDTRGKAPLSPGTKKKSSPSTLRRNARRRKEFLEKKQHPAAVIPREEAVGEKAFLCDQSNSNFKSENGLIHVGKTHSFISSQEVCGWRRGRRLLCRRWRAFAQVPCLCPVLKSRVQVES